MSKWTRTTPITAFDALNEPIEDQIFGPDYDARQRQIKARGERHVSVDRDPWKKPRIQRKAS